MLTMQAKYNGRPSNNAHDEIIRALYEQGYRSRYIQKELAKQGITLSRFAIQTRIWKWEGGK